METCIRNKRGTGTDFYRLSSCSFLLIYHGHVICCAFLRFKLLTGDENSIVEISNYNTGDQDFSAQLTNVKGKNPDVIFAPGNFTESAMIISQARNLGIESPFLGGDTWETPDFLSVGGPAVEGAMITTFFAVEKP